MFTQNELMFTQKYILYMDTRSILIHNSPKLETNPPQVNGQRNQNIHTVKCFLTISQYNY